MALTQCIVDKTSHGGSYVIGKDLYVNPVCAYSTYGTVILKFDGSLKKILFKLYEYPVATLAKDRSNPFLFNNCKIASDLEKCLVLLQQQDESFLSSLEKQKNVIKLKTSNFLQGISVFPRRELKALSHSQPVSLPLKKLVNHRLNGAFFGSLVFYLEDIKSHAKTVDICVTKYNENMQTFSVLTSPLVRSDIGGSFKLNNFTLENDWRELDLEQVRSLKNETLLQELLEIKNNVCGLEVVNMAHRLNEPLYEVFCQLNKYMGTMNTTDEKDLIFFVILQIISNELKNESENLNQSLFGLVKAVWLDFGVQKEIPESGHRSILKSFERVYGRKINTSDDIYFLLKDLSKNVRLSPSDFEAGILSWEKSSKLKAKFDCSLMVKMSIDVCAYAVISGLFGAFSTICVTPAATEMKSKMIDVILPLCHATETNFVHLVNLSKENLCHQLFEVHCIDVLGCSVEDAIKVLAYMAMKVLLTLALYVKDLESDDAGSVYDCIKTVLLHQVLKADASNHRICTTFYPFVQVLRLRTDKLMNGFTLNSWMGYKQILTGEEIVNNKNLQKWLLNCWKI